MKTPRTKNKDKENDVKTPRTKNKDKGKYVFVTGGVVSSVGKGLVTASLSTLMEARGLKVSTIKCDPYINVDPGTLSPFQHGEVYVTEDGAETDLDLGHYERFTHLTLNTNHSITTGQVYQAVINREREGGYLGRTVQVIPHITDEIKSRIFKASEGADVTVVEIGGTIGDIEGLPFIEAIRQLRIELGMSRTIFAHVTLVPYVASAGELKSKPTQHSVKALREVGLQPDFLLCRSQNPVHQALKDKIALFSNLAVDDVISVKDADTIYDIPLLLMKEKFDEKVIHRLNIRPSKPNMNRWKNCVSFLKNPKKEVTIGLVGKYINLKDSYQSLHEALVHGGLSCNTKVKVEYIDSEKLSHSPKKFLKNLDGILVPGGFGSRGIEGKIKAIQYARENKIPFFGICFGMQIAAIEFARNVCKIPQATSREFNVKGAKDFIIDVMEDQKNVKRKGGSMRLGSYPCDLSSGSKVHSIYKTKKIKERHRHRYEFNCDYLDQFEKKGMKITGKGSLNKNLTEIIELPSHPWFVGVQFHPEFKSKLLAPHPLFVSFVGACLKKYK